MTMAHREARGRSLGQPAMSAEGASYVVTETGLNVLYA